MDSSTVWIGLCLVGLVGLLAAGAVVSARDSARAAARRAEFEQRMRSMLDVPAATGSRRVRSQSDPAALYDVDLGTLTCACPDHEKRRRSSSDRDIRRCCKHIAETLLEERVVVENEHELLFALLSNVSGQRSYHIFDGEGEPVVVGVPEDGAWVNVFARSRKNKGMPGRYMRYGYNPDEDRWAHGKKPPGAARFVQEVRRGAKALQA